MGENSKKLLKTLEILWETDEQHPVTSAKIAEKLTNIYGVSTERKAVQRYIQDMNDCGFDIVQHADNKLGYYLGEREFEDWELKVLMDAVQSAKFLSQSDTDKITDHLLKLASADSRKTLKMMNIPADSKRGDMAVKLTIDFTLRAMRAHKKISFDYRFYDDKMQRVSKHPEGTKPVSPYALVWRKDKYYLIGNYEEGKGLSYYRLDRIADPQILDERAVPLQDILGVNAEMKLREFVKKNIYSKKGNYINLRMQTKTNGTDALLDSFGDDVRVTKNADGTLNALVNVADGEGLYSWLIHHANEVTVVEPQHVRDEMKRRLTAMLEDYS